MNSLLQVFMQRDGMTETEAQRKIDAMRQRFLKGEDPDEILHEIGLEPDYFDEIVFNVF